MNGSVAEVFESIQGEGLLAGRRQAFVRLSGCNLRCSYCDTPLAGSGEYSASAVMREVAAFRGPLHSVSFTGGEPLLQAGFLKEMMFICRQQNLRTYLETNGTLPRQLEEVIGLTDIVAMDFKFPSSGGGRDYWFAHREFLGIASRALVFVKAVVCSQTQEEDLDTAIEIIREVNRETVLVFQPNSYQLAQGLSGKLLRFKEKCLKHKVLSCVIPQMHKKWGVR